MWGITSIIVQSPSTPQTSACTTLPRQPCRARDEILKEQLRRLANGFYPEIQKPSSPITVVSRDGHTTITYDPAGTSDK